MLHMVAGSHAYGVGCIGLQVCYKCWCERFVTGMLAHGCILHRVALHRVAGCTGLHFAQGCRLQSHMSVGCTWLHAQGCRLESHLPVGQVAHGCMYKVAGLRVTCLLGRLYMVAWLHGCMHRVAGCTGLHAQGCRLQSHMPVG